jgi:phenylalanyl-tRNA synthetase beta chain
MLISYRWLQRHVDLGGITPEEVARDLTIHTAEVEGLERFAPWLDQIVVGEVVECGKHPDADRLSLCKVHVGAAADSTLSIVCGAPNVAAGQKVAVAPIGTRLPGGLKLKKTKIRGVESQGMISSVRELDLGDEHQGIWVLPGELEVGQKLPDALGLEDWAIEIDNKSLTHRPDLWGHRGIAGEIAAIRGLELRPVDFRLPETEPGEPYPVRIETPGCPRYIGLPIDGVRNGVSPDWLRFLLLAVGQRPLDLLVDLSNFVMLDLGQPNHLFDRRRLAADGILVRDARPGERMATLDEIERTFTGEDMLICSGGEPVAIAGVMGGERSRVEADTDQLLLEVASFHPTLVRRTAMRLGLRTDASARFEKHLDPTLPAKAAAHLVHLLREIQPELRLPRPMGDAGEWQDPAHEVGLRPERLRALLGIEIADDEVERTLASLGFGVERGSPWRVAVPSARATKDVRIEEDLIEEVGRMIGYGAIAERRIHAVLEPPPRDRRRQLVQRLQDRLSGAARFHEALTYSFQEDEILGVLGLLEEPHVRLVNPVVEGQSRVRRSVLPSLLAVLAKNRRQREEIRLFEIGKGYLPEQPNEAGEPRELHQLALVWAAPAPPQGARFDAGVLARLQGLVEELFAASGRSAPAWRRAEAGEAPSWAHPGRCLRAAADAAPDALATLAGLEPGVRRALGLTGELDCEVAACEISIDELLGQDEREVGYRPIPRFPGVKVDVAVAVDESLPAARIAEAIGKAGKGLVEELELFDLYRGANIGEGRKSLAYHVLLQSPDKTLSDKDAAKFLSRLERGVADLGGELRRE